MGVCFHAPHCHTQTMTNGNTLCSLIKFSISDDHHVKIIQFKMVKNGCNIYIATYTYVEKKNFFFLFYHGKLIIYSQSVNVQFKPEFFQYVGTSSAGMSSSLEVIMISSKLEMSLNSMVSK